MERKITRSADGQFCQLNIRLHEGRLSLCGVAGDVLSEREARRQALEYWESFFEDNPDERRDMNERFGRRFSSARGAARFVLQSDGEYHGLDVLSEDDGKVFVGYSFGQIRDEIAEWFPEAVPYFKWHLNDMHAECEHQEARGETYQTHPGAVCPDCGYKLGSGWTKRELPADVVRWAETFGKDEA